MNQKTNYRMEQLSDAVKIPKDVMLGYPIISVVGVHEMTIENYRGILEYNSTCIRVSNKICQIKVEGENLDIPYYHNDEMKITGMIHRIEYI